MGYIDDKVAGYMDDCYRPLDAELSALRERCEREYIPLILRETETFLRVYLEALRPGSILEIGTAYGYSAMFFAKLLPAARITTIEREPDICAIARGYIDAAVLSGRIEVLCGDALDVLEGLAADGERGRRYDFVFIDAGKSHYSDYLNSVLRLCADGAVIICDNIFMRGLLVNEELDPRGKHRTNVRRMNGFLDEIVADPALDVSILSAGDGLAIIKRIRK
ncbi:MAG: O-methyltransferase [Mogibacterium sp.]|nr:O-methyltransferase [Mogibacterium sp.]